MRTLAEIHKEYSEICAQAGHLQYEIAIKSDQVKELNKKLLSLNQEAASVQAQEKKENE